jgi:hypothetical protein
MKSCSKTQRDGKGIYIVVGTSEGEERLGRTRHRWKNGIKIDLKKEIDKLRIASIPFSKETYCENDSNCWIT